MVLAIRLARLIRDGQVKDHAELAHLSHITRAGLRQIMMLLQFAPGIQEELHFLPSFAKGSERFIERQLHRIEWVPSWATQCEM